MVFIYGSENIKRTGEIPGFVVFLSGLSYFQLSFEHTVERLRFVTGTLIKRGRFLPFSQIQLGGAYVFSVVSLHGWRKNKITAAASPLNFSAA